jgi:type VI secretion system protein VasD
MNLYSPPLLERKNTVMELKATKSSKVFSTLCQSFTVLVMLITLSACHSFGKRQTRQATSVELRIDDKLNPDDLGRPLSMVVRLYELRQREAFEKLTLHDLANVADETRLLGQDLIGRHEFILTPGTKRTIEWTPQAETTHMAWVGFYRNPKAQPWRQIVSVQQLDPKPMQLWVGACGLSLYPTDGGPAERLDSGDLSARMVCPQPAVAAVEPPQQSVAPALRSVTHRREKKSR